MHTGAGRPVNMAAIFFLLLSIAVWITPPVTGQGLGQSCGPNNQCDPELECSSRPGANTDDKCRIPAGSKDCNGSDDNCVMNAVCDSGTCKLDVGKTCNGVSDTRCKTGTTCVNVASSGSAVYQCRLGLGQSCDSNNLCATELVCNSRKGTDMDYKCRIPVGSTDCDGNTDNCVKDLVCVSATCRLGLGQSCDSNNLCATELVCNSRKGTDMDYKCRIPVGSTDCDGNTDNCVKDLVCVSATCRLFLGAACDPNNDQCASVVECNSRSGTDVDYKCRIRAGATGCSGTDDNCVKDAVCVSGICRIPAGTTGCGTKSYKCEVDAVCESGTCKLNVGNICISSQDTRCKSNTVCSDVGNGFQCRYDVNVQGCSSSPYCLPSLVCDNNYCKKDAGQSCQTGECRASTECADRGRDGAKCRYMTNFQDCNNDHNMCVPSSVCDGNVCTPILKQPDAGPVFLKMSETSRATTRSVAVEMCTCLLDSTGGNVTDVGLRVCDKATDCKPAIPGGNDKDYYDQLMTWKQFKDAGYRGPYRPSGKNLLSELEQASGRPRRSVSSKRVARAAQSYLTYVIGENQACETAGVTEYCNGPLPPDREFIVIMWVCVSGGCSEAQDSLVIRTAGISDISESVNIGAIVGGVLAFLAVVVIIIILVVIVYRRRHRPKDSSSLSTNQQPVHQVEDILHDQKSVSLILYPARVELLHRNSNHYFKQEYQELLHEENALNYTSDVGKLDINKVKNRSAEICPYDYTRVKLFSQDDLSQDYINASYIVGLRSPCDYLATQGPMMSTISDFWKMVLDHRSPVIVMLSGSTDDGLSKVDQYWPHALNVSVRYGKVNVTMTSMATLPKYTLRNFSVCTNEQDELKVSHFQLMGWEVQGSTFSLEEVADTLYDVGERTSSPAGPVTVHCSDGTARTGSFIALDLLRTYVTQHALGEEVDVFHILLNIIKCRPRMVQSKRQYMFIHDVLRVMVERKMRDEQGRREVYQNAGFRESSVYDTTYSYVPEGSVYETIGNKTPSATTGV